MTIDIDPDVPDLGVEIPRINQVAIAVEDIEDGMARFARILGIDAWRVFHLEGSVHTDTVYRGQSREFSFDVALAARPTDDGLELWRETQTEIELLAPTGGTSSYSDYIETHGEGLHHVACWEFEDPDAVFERFKDAGFEVLQRGRIFDSREYVYFDTRDAMNGVIFEMSLGKGDEPLGPTDSEKIEDVIVN